MIRFMVQLPRLQADACGCRLLRTTPVCRYRRAAQPTGRTASTRQVCGIFSQVQRPIRQRAPKHGGRSETCKTGQLAPAAFRSSVVIVNGAAICPACPAIFCRRWVSKCLAGRRLAAACQACLGQRLIRPQDPASGRWQGSRAADPVSRKAVRAAHYAHEYANLDDAWKPIIGSAVAAADVSRFDTPPSIICTAALAAGLSLRGQGQCALLSRDQHGARVLNPVPGLALTRQPSPRTFHGTSYAAPDRQPRDFGI